MYEQVIQQVNVEVPFETVKFVEVEKLTEVPVVNVKIQEVEKIIEVPIDHVKIVETEKHVPVERIIEVEKVV